MNGERPAPDRSATGCHDNNRASLDAVTQDRFHRGAFEVLQPADRGHRAGSDALLLAAALPGNVAGRLADLGSGAGVAALAALVANPSLSALLVELDPAMADLARRTLALPANAVLAGRASVLTADVTLSGLRRERTGLETGAFDHVLMNPPYNHAGQRSSDDPMRALAHAIGAGGLEPWMRTAAAMLKPGGMMHLVYRTERLAEVIASAQGRFGGLAIVPLHARADRSASRVIIRGVRGSRAPLSIAPGVVLHEPDGSPTPAADALLNGHARLDFAGG